MRSLFPQHEYASVLDIDSSVFKGKELLIFDVDNTLFYPESTEIRADIRKWFQSLQKQYRCVCLSNSHTIRDRQWEIREKLGCELFFSRHKKPSKKLFKEILDTYKVSPDKVVVVGDMRLTDIRFGNRNGATSVLVKPLHAEVLTRIRIARRVENFFVSLLSLFRKA